MREHISREAAWAALRKYNQEPFHLQHALTVEGVMQWYAKELGYGDDAEFWGIVGLLHDIDFERWPEEHCQKAPELLREAGCGEDIIHAVCSHGCGLCCDVAPEHEMEKVLFAADELTGLIGAAALMRPSHSCQDMELKSLKKKYKEFQKLTYEEKKNEIFNRLRNFQKGKTVKQAEKNMKLELKDDSSGAESDIKASNSGKLYRIIGIICVVAIVAGIFLARKRKR